MRLSISAIEFADLQRQLFAPSPAEAAAFLAAAADGDTLRVRSFHVFQPDEVEGDSHGNVIINEDVQVRELAAIKRAGLAAVEVHTHPGSGTTVGFSAYDNDELPSFARYIQNKNPDQPFAALVLGEHGFAGRVWTGDRAEEALELAVIGEHQALPPWLRKPGGTVSGDDSFDRQLRALGPTGHARLRKLRVGIVGLGGTGSQVVQQLAHLGVRNFVLIDDDRVEATNLPRLAGATWWDVPLRRRKGAIARRTIRRIARHPRIESTGTLRRAASLAELANVDLIIGSVDNDGARLILAELAAAYLIPYLDLGVGIEGKPHLEQQVGGRVSFYLPGGPCLACADELDFDEAAQDLETEAQRKIRLARGYARHRSIEPALMPLNTVIVGLGMIELLAFATGLRSVAPFTRYNALTGTVTRCNVAIDEDCPVCRPAHALGSRQKIERYALEQESPAAIKPLAKLLESYKRPQSAARARG